MNQKARKKVYVATLAIVMLLSIMISPSLYAMVGEMEESVLSECCELLCYTDELECVLSECCELPYYNEEPEIASIREFNGVTAYGYLGTTPGAARWDLDANGVVTVGGGTATGVFGAVIVSPWGDYIDYVQKIVFTQPVVGTGSISGLFFGLSNLHTIEGLNLIDTSQVTSMWSVFAYLHSLNSIDISTWDTSNVAGMASIFNSFICPSGRCVPRVLTLGPNFRFVAKESVNFRAIPETEGYTGMWVNVGNGTIENPQANFVFSSAELVENWNSFTVVETWVWQRANANFTVRHFRQEGDAFVEVVEDAENFTGPVGSLATWNANTYDGFTFDPTRTEFVTSGGTALAATIVADGSLVIRLFYTRDVIPPVMVRKIYNGNPAQAGLPVTGVPGSVEVEAGSRVQVSRHIPEKEGFVFTHWEARALAADGVTIETKRLDSGAEFVINRDYELFAQWREVVAPEPCEDCEEYPCDCREEPTGGGRQEGTAPRTGDSDMFLAVFYMLMIAMTVLLIMSILLQEKRKRLER